MRWVLDAGKEAIKARQINILRPFKGEWKGENERI